MTDQQLVREFVRNRSDAAFSELVRRHIDLVYSAAQRLVRNAHLTEDVTQGVFLALAQNARKLTDRPVLSGWLHRTTQNLAANAVRSEVRRRVHEQEAAAMNELLAPEPEASWEEIAPHLDAALGALDDADRDALMLRYFEKKSAPEMAGLLGISDEAAQKRARRAVERLRAAFAKKGVGVGAAALAVLLTANAIQSAPVELAVAVSTTALAGAAATSSTTLTIAKIIAMTTLQKTLVTVTVAVLAGAGIYEARQASQLRQQVHSLQSQASSQTALADQVRQLQRERDDASNRLAAVTGEMAAAKKSPAELLKLRGEVGALRQEKAIAGGKSAINKITSDPEMRKALRDQQKIGLGAIYGDLAKALNLTPEQTGQLNDLLADHIMDDIDLITQALHDQKSRAEIDQMFALQDSKLRDQVGALLGADGLAQYNDYTKNLVNTLSAAQFAGSLTGDAATVAAKKSQLLQALQNATQSTLASAGLPADYQAVPMLNMGNIASQEEASQSLQLLDSIYAQAGSQAGAFLSADELAKFQTFRTNAIQNSLTMLQMNRNLMAPVAQ